MIEIKNCEIVEMLSNNYTLKEIAKKKTVSVRTLHERIDAIKKTTNCSTIAGIVAKYLRNGIIK